MKTEAEVEIDDDEIINYVAKNYSPSYVFSNEELEEWAADHGFTREEIPK